MSNITFEPFVAHSIKTRINPFSNTVHIINISTCVDGVICTAIVNEPKEEGGKENQVYKIKITKEGVNETTN